MNFVTEAKRKSLICGIINLVFGIVLLALENSEESITIAIFLAGVLFIQHGVVHYAIVNPKHKQHKTYFFIGAQIIICGLLLVLFDWDTPYILGISCVMYGILMIPDGYFHIRMMRKEQKRELKVIMTINLIKSVVCLLFSISVGIMLMDSSENTTVFLGIWIITLALCSFLEGFIVSKALTKIAEQEANEAEEKTEITEA